MSAKGTISGISIGDDEVKTKYMFLENLKQNVDVHFLCENVRKSLIGYSNQKIFF